MDNRMPTEPILTDHPKNRRVFFQGDPADPIFCIQEGKIKSTVVSKRDKEAVIAILGVGLLLWARVPSRPRGRAWPPSPLCQSARSWGWIKQA
jgi:hypothetical protein